MGGGSWNYDDWGTFSSAKTVGKTTDEVFSSRAMVDDLNPKGVVRESRDSDDNPESNAIIIALDQTGSMGYILDKMAREGLNTAVTEIYDRKPVTDPQIMCMAIGDVAMRDRAPLQITQFESDIRIAEQLTQIYLERGGGGNSSESYHLPLYFAAMNTTIDCMEKRNRKGYIFTIGDEEVPDALTADQIEEVIGTRPQKEEFTYEEILALASRMYNVYHIIVEEGSHFSYHPDRVTKSWRDVLGQRALHLSDHTKMAELIVSAIQINEGDDKDTVLKSWDGSTNLVVGKALSDITVADAGADGVVKF